MDNLHSPSLTWRARAQPTSSSLTLALTVTDVGLGVDQMEIVEGGLFSGDHWISSTPATWELSVAVGVKMLSVRWRDRAGNLSTGSTQCIILDTIAPTGDLAVVEGSLAEDGAVLLQVTVNEDLTGIQMRLRNDDGEWSEWMPAVETISWALEAGANPINVNSL